MSIFDRKVLVKIHILVAGFIFPVLFMFLLTGALYTWGVKGGYDSKNYDVVLETPLRADQQILLDVINKELATLDIAKPSGQSKIKKMADNYLLEWTGSNRNIILQPTDDPLIASMKIENTRWYRVFVQLHKAKGGYPFKVYAAVFATGLLLLLISGFIMAWQMPKYRKPVFLSASLGILSFVLMVVIS